MDKIGLITYLKCAKAFEERLYLVQLLEESIERMVDKAEMLSSAKFSTEVEAQMTHENKIKTQQLMEYYKSILPRLRAAINDIQDNIETVKNLLNQIYDKGLVPEEYRYYVALAVFREYLANGVCNDICDCINQYEYEKENKIVYASRTPFLIHDVETNEKNLHIPIRLELFKSIYDDRAQDLKRLEADICKGNVMEYVNYIFDNALDGDFEVLNRVVEAYNSIQF